MSQINFLPHPHIGGTEPLKKSFYVNLGGGGGGGGPYYFKYIRAQTWKKLFLSKNNVYL